MSARIHLKTTHPATYEDLAQVPAGYTVELVGGRLHALPRPKGRHIHSANRLGRRIGTPFEDGIGGPGSWWILDKPEVHFVLDTEVTVPDLAGWRRERMPELPEDHKFRVIPDWICEILSPTTREYDLNDKMPLYARYGVRWVWIVDPDERWLDGYRLAGGEWERLEHFEAGHPIRAAPFDAIEFDLFRA